MKISEKKVMTITTAINSIDKYKVKSGGEIVVVHTFDGGFSNFKSVFDNLDLDVDNIKAGDLITIDYVEHEAMNGRVFKNYINIKITQ